MEKVVKYTIIQVVLIAVAILAFVSCKTVGTVKEQVNIKDSTIYHYIYDTIHITVTDTTHIEVHSQVTDSNSLVINFGAGGGTYNAKTGEATNVLNVHQVDTHKEERDSIADLKHQLEIAQAREDSLSQQLTEYEYKLDEERKKARSGYDRFCSTWFWITAILLLIKIAAWVMEKIPATAPYVMIARKFIPFL